MKTIVTALVSLIMGFGAGYFLSESRHYKPTPIGMQQIDSTQLMDLSNRLAAANADLSAARGKISELEPQAAKARQVPVKISRRAALVGNSYVYQFSNLSGKPIRFTVTFSNGSVQKKFSFVADTVLAKEIGHTEGWGGASGDTVTVESAGYDSVTQTF